MTTASFSFRGIKLNEDRTIDSVFDKKHQRYPFTPSPPTSRRRRPVTLERRRSLSANVARTETLDQATLEHLSNEFCDLAKRVEVDAGGGGGKTCPPSVRGYRWVRGEKHKICRPRERVMLHSYPGYTAFRTGLRSGNFLLWLPGLRRMAATFCVKGEVRCQ